MASRADLRTKLDRDLNQLATRVNELEDLAGGVREQIRRNLTVEHHVREHPWASIAVAIASGYLIGKLTS